jgi:hypothetical protein
MRIPVPHPGFKTRALEVEAAGLWRGARLLLDGQPLALKSGKGSARDDAGVERTVELKKGLIDPVPELSVGGEPVLLARPLAWHEYAWMGAPVLLMFMGGALGGGIGFGALCWSARIFRGPRGAPAKYALSALVSAGAVTAFLIAATAAQLAIDGLKAAP